MIENLPQKIIKKIARKRAYLLEKITIDDIENIVEDTFAEIDKVLYYTTRKEKR